MKLADLINDDEDDEIEGDVFQDIEYVNLDTFQYVIHV